MEARIHPENSTSVGPVATFSGVRFFVGRESEVLDSCLRHLEEGQRASLWTVCTPNPEQMRLSWHDQRFSSDLREATINLPDGMGIIWALQHLGISRTAVRIPGRVLCEQLLLAAREKGLSVFLLGGKSGSVERVLERFAHPTGWEAHPGQGHVQHPDPHIEQEIFERIQRLRPAMVFVAYGAPYQERWVMDHRVELEAAGVRIAMVVGGTFEYLAGRVPPVPAWVVRFHGEWLFRLLMEPHRLKRQLIGGEFFLRVLLRRFP